MIQTQLVLIRFEIEIIRMQSEFREIFNCMFSPLIQIHHDYDLAELMITVIAMIYAFGALTIACEVSQGVNQAFDECSEMFDQLDWYLFPIELQRMYPMILAFIQEPIEITFFGSMPCGRELFKCVGPN